MTVHTLTHIHFKKRGYRKGAFQEEEAEEVRKCETIKEENVSAKPTKTITTIRDDMVNTYIKETPEIATHYLEMKEL